MFTPKNLTGSSATSSGTDVVRVSCVFSFTAVITGSLAAMKMSSTYAITEPRIVPLVSRCSSSSSSILLCLPPPSTSLVLSHVEEASEFWPSLLGPWFWTLASSHLCGFPKVEGIFGIRIPLSVAGTPVFDPDNLFRWRWKVDGEGRHLHLGLVPRMRSKTLFWYPKRIPSIHILQMPKWVLLVQWRLHLHCSSVRLPSSVPGFGTPPNALSVWKLLDWASRWRLPSLGGIVRPSSSAFLLMSWCSSGVSFFVLPFHVSVNWPLHPLLLTMSPDPLPLPLGKWSSFAEPLLGLWDSASSSWVRGWSWSLRLRSLDHLLCVVLLPLGSAGPPPSAVWASLLLLHLHLHLHLLLLLLLLFLLLLRLLLLLLLLLFTLGLHAGIHPSYAWLSSQPSPHRRTVHASSASFSRAIQLCSSSGSSVGLMMHLVTRDASPSFILSEQRCNLRSWRPVESRSSLCFPSLLSWNTVCRSCAETSCRSICLSDELDLFEFWGHLWCVEWP